MACYVDVGIQLMITGRNNDSSWLRVFFGQGQTCFVFDQNSIRTDITPDPTLEYWVFHSTVSVSGDLSGVSVIGSTGTPSPYGGAFLWNDRFDNSEQNRGSSFEQKLFPVSLILTGAGLVIWLGMIFRSSIASSRRKRAFVLKHLASLIHVVVGLR